MKVSLPSKEEMTQQEGLGGGGLSFMWPDLCFGMNSPASAAQNVPKGCCSWSALGHNSAESLSTMCQVS